MRKQQGDQEEPRQPNLAEGQHRRGNANDGQEERRAPGGDAHEDTRTRLASPIPWKDSAHAAEPFTTAQSGVPSAAASAQCRSDSGAPTGATKTQTTHTARNALQPQGHRPASRELTRALNAHERAPTRHKHSQPDTEDAWPNEERRKGQRQHHNRSVLDVMMPNTMGQDDTGAPSNYLHMSTGHNERNKKKHTRPEAPVLKIRLRKRATADRPVPNL